MTTVIRDNRDNKTQRIHQNSKASSELYLLYSVLPSELMREINLLFDMGKVVSSEIEELRIRRDFSASLTTSRGNLLLDYKAKGADMEKILVNICDDSIYAHSETIRQGFVTIKNGIRVGICGRATYSGDSIIGVYDISSLNFRIPKRIVGVGRSISELLLREDKGILIFSPPGVGKTTLLRGIARELSSGRTPRRVSVIDTRQELAYSLDSSAGLVDILSGYPRAIGIEIALRCMNPQLIICDEIGETAEARAMLSAQSCGVPIVASAHGESIEGLLRREGIKMLHESRLFGYYVGIDRDFGKREYNYHIYTWEDADDRIKNCGSDAVCHMRNIGMHGA